jgi:hypothetical protein
MSCFQRRVLTHTRRCRSAQRALHSHAHGLLCVMMSSPLASPSWRASVGGEGSAAPVSLPLRDSLRSGRVRPALPSPKRLQPIPLILACPKYFLQGA